MPVIYTIPFVVLTLYLWWRVTAAFPCLRKSWIFNILYCALLLVCIPFLLHWRPRGELNEWLMFIPLTWMAVVAFLFWPFALMDGWNLVFWGVSRFWKRGASVLIPLRKEGIVACSFLGVAILWGLWEANFPRIHRLEVEALQLTEEVRIGCISDLHLSPVPNWYRLNKVIRILNQEDVDILVNLGDLSDGRGKRLERQVDALRQLHCRTGVKVSVEGNHEYREGLDYTLGLHARSGFQLLKNQSVMVGEHLLLYGVEDKKTEEYVRPSEAVTIPDHPADKVFGLYLIHQPDPPLVSGEWNRVDLQLSGHTHGGQIFPNTLATRWRYRVPTGELLDTAWGGKLYIHRGTGLYGPPFRIGARSEIVFLTLKPGARKQ